MKTVITSDKVRQKRRGEQLWFERTIVAILEFYTNHDSFFSLPTSIIDVEQRIEEELRKRTPKIANTKFKKESIHWQTMPPTKPNQWGAIEVALTQEALKTDLDETTREAIYDMLQERKQPEIHVLTEFYPGIRGDASVGEQDVSECWRLIDQADLTLTEIKEFQAQMEWVVQRHCGDDVDIHCDTLLKLEADAENKHLQEMIDLEPELIRLNQQIVDQSAPAEDDGMDNDYLYDAYMSKY